MQRIRLGLVAAVVSVVVVTSVTLTPHVPYATAQEPTTTATAPLTGIVTAEALNVRNGPGADYDAVGVVYKDDVLDVTGRNDDASWLHITKESVTGWVSARHVSVNGDTSSLPVAPVEPGAAKSTPANPPEPAATPGVKDQCQARANPEATYREVDKSDTYIGQTVAWKGKVFNIRETSRTTWFQAWYFEGRHLSEPGDAFVVLYNDVLPDVYEDTEVFVCGVVAEDTEGTNAYGATIYQPTIVADYIEVWQPATPPAAVPPTPVPMSKDSSIGVEHKSAIWTLKLTDVKRAKAVYFFGKATVAMGTHVIPMVEFRNDGSGTAAPSHNFDFYLQDDQGRTYDYDMFNDAVLGAAWQFQMGHLYDDINPGLALGIALPFDVPLDMGDVWLLAKQDPGLVMYLGNVGQLPDTQ